MSIVFNRYNVRTHESEYGQHTEEILDSEGEYVKAQDAYDKCASLSAQITTLKEQLKGYQEREKLHRTATFAFAYGASAETIEKVLRST